jgi:hypothetical protein
LRTPDVAADVAAKTSTPRTAQPDSHDLLIAGPTPGMDVAAETYYYPDDIDELISSGYY